MEHSNGYYRSEAQKPIAERPTAGLVTAPYLVLKPYIGARVSESGALLI